MAKPAKRDVRTKKMMLSIGSVSVVAVAAMLWFLTSRNDQEPSQPMPPTVVLVDAPVTPPDTVRKPRIRRTDDENGTVERKPADAPSDRPTGKTPRRPKKPRKNTAKPPTPPARYAEDIG